MQFDSENPINKLCIQGMQSEGNGEPKEAARLFYQAWNEASNAEEKFTAAHYVARQQETTADKLKWDTIALEFALQINSAEIKSVYPSLYLNIAKDFEDLHDFDKAGENYQLGLNYIKYLPADGYGNMIESGIRKGIQRIEMRDLE